MTPLEKFLERKEKNLQNAKDKGYFLIENHPKTPKKVLVKLDSDGNICGSPCLYCLEHTDLDPFRNGGYVYTLCIECLRDIGIIENHLKPQDNSIKKGRKTMVSPDQVEIDWDNFEKIMTNNQARLTDLAKRYKLYPDEMKSLIVNKYKDRVKFKKGRNGGIRWTDPSGNTKKDEQSDQKQDL